MRPWPSCPPCSGIRSRTGCGWSSPAGGSAGQDDARFGAVKDAILARRALSFLYLSASGPRRPRRVYPARLVFKGQSWYLQALCLDRGDYRTFKLTRMLELETGAPFDQMLSPPPMENGWTGDAPVVSVRLRFPPSRAYRVYDEFDEGCVTRRRTGSLEAAVPSRRTRGCTAICSPSAWGWRCWSRRGCGGGWPGWRRIWQSTMETLTQGCQDMWW